MLKIQKTIEAMPEKFERVWHIVNVSRRETIDHDFFRIVSTIEQANFLIEKYLKDSSNNKTN